MEVFVSPSGWVEVHNPQDNETRLQSFYNLKNVIKGKGFIVIHLNSGMVEVYDQRLNLLGHKVIKGVEEIRADDNISVTLQDGTILTLAKDLAPAA